MGWDAIVALGWASKLPTRTELVAEGLVPLPCGLRRAARWAAVPRPPTCCHALHRPNRPNALAGPRPDFVCHPTSYLLHPTPAPVPAQVRAAYRRKGWALANVDHIEQCAHDAYTEAIKEQAGEGCHMWGMLEVRGARGAEGGCRRGWVQAWSGKGCGGAGVELVGGSALRQRCGATGPSAALLVDGRSEACHIWGMRD